MKSKSERMSKTVGNILQVTKNTIQLTDNYYNYYINKDNALYMKQIPLLVQKAKMQAVAIKKKENEKNYIDGEENKVKSQSIDKFVLPLNDIRNAQNRSKRLPPLCPFYNNKGELLRSVVTTSKIFNRQYLNDDVVKSPTKKIKMIKLKNNIVGENTPGTQQITIDFDDFQNDFFYDPEYSTLVYKDSDIFGKKEHYFELIKNKIEEIKTTNIDDKDKGFKKEKIFEKNKQKKNISLIFNSLSVKIYEIQVDQKDNEKQNNIFEYNLPFIYLPLFYFKGEEKFKIFLSKIIQWDNEDKKFTLNENPEKIFQDILKNCADFNKKEKKEEPKKETKHTEDSGKPSKQKFNFTMGGKKTFKKDLAAFKFNPLSNTIIEEQNLAQTMVGNIPNTYLTNLDDTRKKYDIISQQSLYPTQKDHNYINYNNFEFLWLTPNKNFKVCINTPLAIIEIPKNHIKVKKYIDFELLFYLYENDFKNWDFYFVKYLSSFKSFRTLLEDINSINESYNKDFYLTQPRIKSYLFNNTKIINIATVKQKDALENLIEGLMGIPEEKKEDDTKNDKNKNKNSSRKEMIKVDKKEENKKIVNNTNKDDKKDKEEKDNEKKEGEKIENKEKEEKEKEVKDTDNQNKGEDIQKKEDTNKKEEPKKEEKKELNIVMEENPKQNEEITNEDLINSTFVEKCFIAIIRFADTKTFKANEYRIYFNFSQFQKFQKMEKYIDKISFLIKFIDINYIKKSVHMDYKSLDNFDEKEWIKDFNQYNTQYLKDLDSKINNNQNEYIRNSAEYIGMTKNSVIQIEILTPISLARTLTETGIIKTEKAFLNNSYQNKAVNIQKDDILGMSILFYNCYGEEQNNKKT